MTKEQFKTEFWKLIINYKTGEGGFAEIGIDPDEDYSVLPRGKESEGTIGRLNYLLGQIGDYWITDSEPHEESRKVIDGPGYIEEDACDYYRTNIPMLLLEDWTLNLDGLVHRDVLERFSDGSDSSWALIDMAIEKNDGEGEIELNRLPCIVLDSILEERGVKREELTDEEYDELLETVEEAECKAYEDNLDWFKGDGYDVEYHWEDKKILFKLTKEK